MSDPVTEEDTSVPQEENVEEQVEAVREPEEATIISEAEGEVMSENRPHETVAEKGNIDESTPTAIESQSTVESIVEPSTDPHTIDTAPTEPDASQQSLSSSQGPVSI